MKLENILLELDNLYEQALNKQDLTLATKIKEIQAKYTLANKAPRGSLDDYSEEKLQQLLIMIERT